MAAGQTCYTTYVLNSTNYNEAYVSGLKLIFYSKLDG
jgi:hypothetical protein